MAFNPFGGYKDLFNTVASFFGIDIDRVKLNQHPILLNKIQNLVATLQRDFELKQLNGQSAGLPDNLKSLSKLLNQKYTQDVYEIEKQALNLNTKLDKNVNEYESNSTPVHLLRDGVTKNLSFNNYQSKRDRAMSSYNRNLKEFSGLENKLDKVAAAYKNDQQDLQDKWIKSHNTGGKQ